MHAHNPQAFAAAKGERPPSAPPALPRASREEMESAASAYQEPSPPPSPRLSGGGSAGVADLPPHPAGPPVSPPPTNRHRCGAGDGVKDASHVLYALARWGRQGRGLRNNGKKSHV